MADAITGRNDIGL